MSKLVKGMITDELRERWEGVNELVLADISALQSNQSWALRKQLREKNLHILVVKNSLARKATAGTALGPAFEGEGGSTAVIWGAEDVVSLAKEVTGILGDKKYEKMTGKGGVLDGSKLSAEQVLAVSKWPNRLEQLSILVGQILSPGAKLSGQLVGTARGLASQIKQISEKEDATDGTTDSAAE